MFMDFLKSLSMFGEKAPPERIQELIEIIESQADLDAEFDVCTLFSVSLPYMRFYLWWSEDFEDEGVDQR